MFEPYAKYLTPPPLQLAPQPEKLIIHQDNTPAD